MDRDYGVREAQTINHPKPQQLGKDAVREAERPQTRQESARSRALVRPFVLRESESAFIRDVGRFRTLAAKDVSAERYQDRPKGVAEDLRSLIEKGLVRRRTVYAGRKCEKLVVVALTKAGKEIAVQQESDGKQVLYSGFVKPAEIVHDAAIYRMYRAEAARIVAAGGKVHRIVLDYELKRLIYSPLGKAKSLPPQEQEKARQEIANANGLRVVSGRIPLPDLRIEYETAQGDLTKVDLELATEHYHGEHVASKVEAGFKVYAADGSADRLARAMEEREITAEILSL